MWHFVTQGKSISLDTFSWATRTGEVWAGECIPGILGLFLVELEPARPEIDEYIWVVVGDLPPAFLSSLYAKSPRGVLDGYIGEILSLLTERRHTSERQSSEEPPCLLGARDVTWAARWRP